MPKVELGKLRSLRLLLGKPTPTYQLHNGIKLFSKENLNLKSAELCFTQYLFFNFCTFRNYFLINNILLTLSKFQRFFFDQLKQILQNTIVKVKVSKLADGFGEQDTIYEQTKIEEWALYKVHIF